MNRVLKFRVWGGGTYHYDTDNYYLDLDGNIRCKYGKEHQLDIENWTVQQYTGLKDKNGKEIYEGDIIKQHHGFIETPEQDWIGFVYFGSRLYKGNNMYENGWAMETFIGSPREKFSFKINENCEVIGNIFEKPELLS